MSSLISSVAWVRRGVAAQHPAKYVLDEKEVTRVSGLARVEFEDVQKEMERANEIAKTMGKDNDEEEDMNGDDDDEDDSAWVDEDEDDAMDQDPVPKPKADPNDLSEYNLDDYDKETTSIAAGPFSNIKGLTYYKDNKEDPYISFNGANEDEVQERQELEVLPTDNLLVTAKTEENISSLEIYVYDESEENLYVHHDMMIPAFPLCLEWLDYCPSFGDDAMVDDTPLSKFGNYIAVGTFDPEIEIWSLDMVDALYPDLVLGRPDKTAAHVPEPLGTGKKKRKKVKARSTSSQHHVDAVLSLSWNKVHRHLLASASADRTVKIWDLNRNPLAEGEGAEVGALSSFDVHKDKVQSVQWNVKQPSVLLTGSYDRTIRSFDSRSPGQGVGVVVGSDVEALKWDPWDENSFFASLENGLVLNFDVRSMPSDPYKTTCQPRFTLAAHDGATSALDVNPHIRGCIVTGGTDKLVKVWNIKDQQSKSGKLDVSLVTSRDLGVGKVFSATFSPDDPLTVAAAGSKAKLQIWEVGANAGARKAFAAKLAQAGKELKEKTTGGVIGVASDGEGESGDEAD